MAKKIERTAPGSKNDWRVTYRTDTKKWTNDRPGDGKGDPDELERTFDDLTVKRGLKRLEKAVNAYTKGKGTKAILDAVEALEQHAGKDEARTAIRKVHSIERTELKGNKTDLQKKVVEGLAVAKKHLNRDRKAGMKMVAYMKGEPPTPLHRAAVDRLRDFWNATDAKSYVSFNAASDIKFENKVDYQAVRMNIYTDKDYFSLVVHIEPDKPIEQWYMGMTGGTRFHRPTEDWTRGNDLPDGKFTFELWGTMLHSALSYELLSISEYVSDEYLDVSETTIAEDISKRMRSISSQIASTVLLGRYKFASLEDEAVAFEQAAGSSEFLKVCGSAICRMLVEKNICSRDELRAYLEGELRSRTARIRRVTASLLEKIPKEHDNLWYENEKGEKWLPDMESGIPNPPEGFEYQVSRFPAQLDTKWLKIVQQDEVDACAHPDDYISVDHGLIDGVEGETCDKCGGYHSRKTGEAWPKWDASGSVDFMGGSSGWSEDLALALVGKGFSLSNAIIVAATSCERCMNVLADECGLDWGYPEASEDYEKCGTECSFCKGSS